MIHLALTVASFLFLSIVGLVVLRLASFVVHNIAATPTLAQKNTYEKRSKALAEEHRERMKAYRERVKAAQSE